MLTLYGKPVAESLDEETKTLLGASHKPTLVILDSSKSSENALYARSLIKRGKNLGFDVEYIQNIESEKDLIYLLRAYSKAPHTKVLPLAPLPESFSYTRCVKSLSAKADSDGLALENIAHLALSSKDIAYTVPSTALATIKLLDWYGFDYAKKSAAIIGRSNTVGKPLFNLLLERDMTVTMCHSKTPDLDEQIKNKDLVVSCAGVPKLISARDLSAATWAVDIGTNVDADGKLVGDIDLDGARLSAATPVPKGIGPVTTSALFWQIAKTL